MFQKSHEVNFGIYRNVNKFNPYSLCIVVRILGSNKHVRTMLEVTRKAKDFNTNSGKNNIQIVNTLRAMIDTKSMN